MDNRCMLWLRKSIEHVLILWFIHTLKTVSIKLDQPSPQSALGTRLKIDKNYFI